MQRLLATERYVIEALYVVSYDTWVDRFADFI